MASFQKFLKENPNTIENSFIIGGKVHGNEDSTVLTLPTPTPVQGKDLGRSREKYFATVNLDRIIPDPDQPRKEFDQEALEELAKSIQWKQVNPISVEFHEDKDRWVILAGERRYRAAVIAGLTTIKCYCYETPLPKAERIKIQLVENVQREDLKPLELAAAYSETMEYNCMTGVELAAYLNVSSSKISKYLNLLEISVEIQKLVNSGELSVESAYEISKLSLQEEQEQVAEQAVQEKWNRSKVQEIVRERNGKSAKRRVVKLRNPPGKLTHTETHVSEDKIFQLRIQYTGITTYHALVAYLENEVLPEFRGRANHNVTPKGWMAASVASGDKGTKSKSSEQVSRSSRSSERPASME